MSIGYEFSHPYPVPQLNAMTRPSYQNMLLALFVMFTLSVAFAEHARASIQSFDVSITSTTGATIEATFRGDPGADGVLEENEVVDFDLTTDVFQFATFTGTNLDPNALQGDGTGAILADLELSVLPVFDPLADFSIIFGTPVGAFPPPIVFPVQEFGTFSLATGTPQTGLSGGVAFGFSSGLSVNGLDSDPDSFIVTATAIDPPADPGAVPEPVSLLVWTGLAGVFGVQARRRKQA